MNDEVLDGQMGTVLRTHGELFFIAPSSFSSETIKNEVHYVIGFFIDEDTRRKPVTDEEKAKKEEWAYNKWLRDIEIEQESRNFDLEGDKQKSHHK